MQMGMPGRIGVLLLVLLCAGRAATAQETLKLAASPALIESGVLKYMLPRFSLKTGIGFDMTPLETGGGVPAGIDVVLTGVSPETGARLVMMRGDQGFYVMLRNGGADDKRLTRFVDWLFSDVGRNTIASFKPGGEQMFTAADTIAAAETEITFDGNILTGEALAYRNCGRCHVVGPQNRMNGIGSTPSFALLRTFPDWQDRFMIYFTLNPHPSFTRITGVTEPFNPAVPPPLVPLTLTPGQLDDILAFVATIKPADLGAPLVHQ
jgi:mono/diheme cytochrome c family protein